MTIWAHVIDGVVVGSPETLPDEWVPGHDIYPPEVAAAMVACDAVVQEGWLYDGHAFKAPSGASVSDLADRVCSAAAASCAAITQQVVPDDTHRLAYQNAAVLVFASNGAAPTVEPAKSTFAAQAQAQGLTADAFAAVVQGVTLVSLQLATILSTLRTAALTAKTPAALASALSAFETAIGQVVTTLNGAGLTISITPPAPIVIGGISAS